MNFFTKQKTLKDLGYCFNRDLVLVDSVRGLPFKFKNQRDYEILGEAITDDVYARLENLGLSKVKLSGSRSSFFFANREVVSKEAPKVLVLIHGNGVVRAGQWSRKLIINNGLREGSQLEFIKKAHEEGYAVIVTNTNQDVEYTSKEDHAALVWKQLIKNSPCEHVVIIAHSYGGQVTMDLAKRFPDDFLSKVKGIYLTDSAHHGITSNRNVKRKLVDISLNYVASAARLNTPVSSYGDIRCVSAGATSHEWTSFCAFRAIFDEMKKLDRGFGQSGGNLNEGLGSALTVNHEKMQTVMGHSDESEFEAEFCNERRVLEVDDKSRPDQENKAVKKLTDGVYRGPGQETIHKYD